MENGFIFMKKKNKTWKREKDPGGPFKIYQLISTANPALFEEIRAGLAVLNSW